MAFGGKGGYDVITDKNWKIHELIRKFFSIVNAPRIILKRYPPKSPPKPLLVSSDGPFRGYLADPLQESFRVRAHRWLYQKLA
jgi:hypothetical protein